MIEPPKPADEQQRLALLKACNIIYTPAEEAFDDIAQLAADLCGTEIALITLVDADYQWFKARVGVDRTGTPRDLSFCGHCINHADPLIVEDTHQDARFADNPLVTGDPFIRFYAGVPLLVDEGSSIGALSVASRKPRTITPREIASLERLAKQVARELRLRRDLGRVTLAPADEEVTVKAGTVIAGRWRIVREIGSGATGTVFEASDERGHRVAVKVLHARWASNDVVVERFAREARVLMRLRSPHVGKLLDVGNLDGGHAALPYLALEYLEGTDLDRLIESRGRLPYAEAFAFCADACEGVGEAHELGVVHRDLKPSNVFLADREGSDRPIVKVLDFGIAAGDTTPEAAAKITSVDTIVGSPAYMSPEQLMSASEVDPRSDIWSMGAVLYELVTGETPFRGEQLELFANIMTKPPIPFGPEIRNEMPAAAQAILLKCLRRAREDRFDSMTALARALREAAAPV